jgi:hypothetical protein
MEPTGQRSRQKAEAVRKVGIEPETTLEQRDVFAGRQRRIVVCPKPRELKRPEDSRHNSAPIRGHLPNVNRPKMLASRHIRSYGP